MSQTVIKVDNLSKRYQLGTIGYGSLQHDLRAWWARARGKEDPNARIGEKSRLDLHGEFWALNDVGFEVERGDRVGVVGRNGAGKSTLLKLLSRVTSPTTGTIKIQGRIASLLEVGTGFHPELTGRENVFLNGAILGMKRREIQSKFDEIVSFAGVEQFIDTPVKRYSSGMYVRLAFSVAANLDSDILIIDEVLAVGDSDFQTKCLGKMDEISKGQGRTLLFVSHNMGAIRRLCNKGIFLKKGSVSAAGPGSDVFSSYENEGSGNGQSLDFSQIRPSIDNGTITMKSMVLRDSQRPGQFVGRKNQNLEFEFRFQSHVELKKVLLSLSVKTLDGALLFNTPSDTVLPLKELVAGDHEALLTFRASLLVGSYELHFGIAANSEDLWWMENIARLEIVDDQQESRNRGLIDVPFGWTVK